MGWFPFTEGKLGASGSLIKHEAYQSSDSQGILIYFSSSDIKMNLVE